MSANKYEYRMTLGELTNTLQNLCHDGHANKFKGIASRGRKMTKYEYLINKADECETKALKEKNPDMLLFWKHASEGFKQKALNLTVEEGIKPHD